MRLLPQSNCTRTPTKNSKKVICIPSYPGFWELCWQRTEMQLEEKIYKCVDKEVVKNTIKPKKVYPPISDEINTELL